MKYYFCLIPAKDAKQGVNIGRTYAYAHKSQWIEGSSIATYLTTGYVKGVDHVSYKGKAYILMKTYLDLEQNCAIILATESVNGCDC